MNQEAAAIDRSDTRIGKLGTGKKRARSGTPAPTEAPADDLEDDEMGVTSGPTVFTGTGPPKDDVGQGLLDLGALIASDKKTLPVVRDTCTDEEYLA